MHPIFAFIYSFFTPSIIQKPVFNHLPYLKATISIPNPAFVFEMKFDSVNQTDLLISTFSGTPFTTDYVYQINSINSKNLKPERLDAVAWPNEMTRVDEQVFGQEGIVIAGGFLVKVTFINTGKRIDNVRSKITNRSRKIYSNTRKRRILLPSSCILRCR